MPMDNSTQNKMDNKQENSNEETVPNPKSSTKHNIGDHESIEQFTKVSLSSIVEATKSVNMFPSGGSRDLYCAYPTFGKIVDRTSFRILELISRVLQHQHIKGNIEKRQKDEQFELLMECNDFMLERINSSLDEMAGLKKNSPPVLLAASTKSNAINHIKSNVGSWNLSQNTESSSSSITLLAVKNIPRPQINFKIPVDNSADKPFEPKIKEKPNSLKPLAILPEYDEDGNIESFLHPYEFELTKFEPPDSQLKSGEPKLPKKIENTPFEYIDTEEKLTKLVYDLNNATEIAIDLEHHSYRSFLGISCLIQISTRLKDYVIDGLVLRDELHVLNSSFTNPKILKIFHGAEMDIQWLQRDFALYVVNMFDTHQAAKILNFPRLSLAYLLKHYCDVEADKTYQLADWRIRPLPEDLIRYARQDTHYLIYIYELLRNELINKGNNEINLLKTVYQRSVDICKKRYIKPTIESDSHMDLYRRSKKIFDNRQLFALKEIYMWRDKISRNEDESFNYVLPNHMMLQIAENLPREMQGILACCNPIPPLVRQNLHALHQIILKARDQPLIKPIIQLEMENRNSYNLQTNYKFNCPNDLLNNPEFRNDLPTLLSTQKNEIEDCSTLFAEPIITVFKNSIDLVDEAARKKLDKLRKTKFITPYERYKAVIPYAEKQKLEEISQEEAIRKSKVLCPINDPVIIKSVVDKKSEQGDEGNTKSPIKNDLKRKRQVEPSATVVSNPKKLKDSSIGTSSGNQKGINAKKATNSVEIKIEGDSSQDNKFENKNKNDNKKVEDSENQREKGNKLGTQHSKNGNKPLPRMKTAQSSAQPVAFDISKVDFKKFQGGAKRAQPIGIKPKFYGKNKGSTQATKKLNKLFSFSQTGKK